MILIARKTKLSDALIEISVQNVKNCLSRTACAQAIGISYETWRTWESLGRQGKEPYSRFYIAIQSAEIDLMTDLLKQVKKRADMGDLSSITFLLERRWPDQWGKQSQLNVNAKTQSQNLNVNANVDFNNFEETERIRQKILARLAPKGVPPRISVTEARENF